MDLTKPHKRISLATKFNFLTIALILITSVGICFFLIRTEMKHYERELQNHGESIADATAKNCEYGIFTEDQQSLSYVLDSLSADADIAYVVVMKRGLEVIASRTFQEIVHIPPIPFQSIDADRSGASRHRDFEDAASGKRYLEVFLPVTSNMKNLLSDDIVKHGGAPSKVTTIGYLRLGLTQEGLRKRIRQLLFSSILFTTVLVLLGSGLTFLATRMITSPLDKLKTGIQNISEGNFESRINIATNDEIADLARSFEHMRDNLRIYRKEVEDRTAELTASYEQLLKEIKARKLAEEHLRHDAFYDGLTSLPNRALFMDRLARAIGISKRRKSYSFSVLFLDMDRFKVINDSLGHIIGDQLLIAFGNRLALCLRPGDTVARLGGDEFAILLEDVKDPGNARFVSERIQKELISPFSVGGHDVFITASIGIAMCSSEYDNPEQILRDADTAMYQAKSRHQAEHVFFEPNMHSNAVERLQLETDLRRAVERREFVTYYQPIVSIKTEQVIGFEALVRWKHPERGFVSPADFVPISEETGVIVSIDRLVLNDACRQMRMWQEQIPGHALNFISVNLSNRQMMQPDLVEHVAQVLQETGLKSEYLKLEITENVIMENPESTTAMLSRLRALGIQLYIDDFGTGYSSLSYLHRLPINGFKIDRSFISRMGENGENQEIVRTILLLARDLKVNVVAEGIETARQLEQITSLNCEYWQGYLLSKPVASEQARTLINGGLAWNSASAA